MQPRAGTRRPIYFLASVIVVASGLLWRSGRLPISPFFVKYGGDAWWAALVYFLIRFCRPTLSTPRSAMLAVTISFSVEFGQLYHAPWIDAVRQTRIGALALGNTFNWPDLPAYAVGILLAAGVEGISYGHRIPRWKRSRG